MQPRATPSDSAKIESASSPEERLVLQAAKGDREAFETLARRWWPRMGAFCAAAAGFDADLAEDAAQEALFRLYQALPRFRGESAFGTFVYRICRNATIDRLRSQARERRRRVPFPKEGEEAGAGLESFPDERFHVPDPAVEYLRKERDEELAAAMEALEPDERTLVYLRDVEGLGIAELAGIFRLPEGTIKSRLSRVRARLARMLEEAVDVGR